MQKQFLLFFLLINAFFSFGQKYKFNIFSQDEGLPQPYVYDIVQAKNGFLYLATGDGLGMFGGTKIKKANTSDGLAENFCNSLFIDSKQQLWIGHFEGGVSFLKNYKFSKLNTKKNTASKIVGFAEDAKGTIYFANSAGSIYTINDTVVKPLIQDELEPINDIRIHNELLYIATHAGLFYVDLKDKSYNIKSISETLGKNSVSIDFFNKTDLVLATDGDGILIFKNKNNSFQRITTIYNELTSLRKSVKDILVKNNSILVSLHGEGIKTFDLNSEYKIIKEKKIDSRNGLKNLFINKLFFDSENNLWLGSYGAGLFQMTSQRFELYNQANVLPFENIKTLTTTKNDELIITNEKQLFVFNPKSDIPNFSNELINSSAESEIRTSYYDRQKNELLVGTTKGLYLYEILNGATKFKKEIALLKDKSINYITKTNENTILIATTEGLFILNELHQLVTYYSTDTGLLHNNVKGCFIDNQKQLWMFSPETPLYKIHNDSIEVVRELDAISSYQFNNAVQDKEGNIWFGTDGGGIYKYSATKKVTHYTTENGLNSDFIYALAITNKGDLLAGHKNGLSIKYQNINYFKAFTRAGGLQATNINANAISKDLQGNIWMGTTEGLLKYLPQEDKINNTPPILNLLQLKINNKRANISDSIFDLSYDKYELAIDYIGVSLSNPKEVTYKYKLEGFSNTWQTTNEQKIIFPKLEDGEYRLVIHAINSDGVQTPKPITIKINISKPYWKSIWFYALCATLLSGIWYIIYRVRTEALLKIKAQLEKMVAIKTNELVVEKERVEKVNELLEEKNHDITDSIAYAQRIQSAILPSLEGISKKLNAFVFYQPRDIVSGDFYWYYETENYFYIAAVDCTGHGVPGAFMSLLGGTYLDQIMIENKEPLPAEILSILDTKIFNSFHYEGNANEIIRDGMDVAICQLNKQKKEMILSNASRAIYLVINDELIEIKSNHISIGGKTNDDKEFENTSMPYNKDSCVYLFSDGYCDQFGGDRNKRFTTKRLKALLTTVSKLPINEQQQQIAFEFQSWKGDTEQTDDVLFIGIKL